MTTVSVVVPTHNRPELMTRAVASAAAQDWDGEIEIIVVFDASEVFTPDVALAAGRSIRVQENVRSRGLAGARNTGIASATGEWVAFLDDDDIWHRGKLSRQFAALAEHPEAQMCVSGMTIDNGRALVERPLDAATIHLDELIRDRLAAVHSSSFLIRREALLTDVGLIDEELPASYAEDYDILLRAARRAPIVAVPEPLITVTWKGQSLFAKNWPAISDALQHMLDKHPEFDEDPIGRARIEAQIAIAESGRGDKRSGRAWLARAARSNPREKRLPVGALVSYGVLTPERANRMAAYVGRGI